MEEYAPSLQTSKYHKLSQTSSNVPTSVCSVCVCVAVCMVVCVFLVETWRFYFVIKDERHKYGAVNAC